MSHTTTPALAEAIAAELARELQKMTIAELLSLDVEALLVRIVIREVVTKPLVSRFAAELPGGGG